MHRVIAPEGDYGPVFAGARSNIDVPARGAGAAVTVYAVLPLEPGKSVRGHTLEPVHNRHAGRECRRWDHLLEVQGLVGVLVAAVRKALLRLPVGPRLVAETGRA